MNLYGFIRIFIGITRAITAKIIVFKPTSGNLPYSKSEPDADPSFATGKSRPGRSACLRHHMNRNKRAHSQ